MKKRASIGIFALLVFFLLASAFLILYQNTRLKSEFLDNRREALKRDLEAESIANFFRTKPEEITKILTNSKDTFRISTAEMTKIKNKLGLNRDFYIKGEKRGKEIYLSYSFESSGRRNYRIKGLLKEEFSEEELEELKENLLAGNMDSFHGSNLKGVTVKKGDWVFFQEEDESFHLAFEEYEKQLKEIEVKKLERKERENSEENEDLEELEEYLPEEELKIIGEPFEKDLLFTGSVQILDSLSLERIHFVHCEFQGEEIQLKDSLLFLEKLPENLKGSGDWLNPTEIPDSFQQKNIIQRPVFFEFLNFSKIY